MSIKQSYDDLVEHLKNQIKFICGSTKSYDRGFQEEAIRLAVAFRILLHDTRKSVSLLIQLKKNNILFYDTARTINPGNRLPDAALIQMRLSTKSGADYNAPIDDLPPERLNIKIPFDKWWNKSVIKALNNSYFTRKDLILNIADKDGGAHIDPSLDEEYALLSRYNSMGWRVIKNGEDTTFKNRVEFASIRQIAHEVLKTFKDEFPDLF